MIRKQQRKFYRQIMQQKSKPRSRAVQRFDDKIWIKVREEIVYRGVHEKFRQNPELAEKLERTGKEIIAECAVKDRIWELVFLWKMKTDSALINGEGKICWGRF